MLGKGYLLRFGCWAVGCWASVTSLDLGAGQLGAGQGLPLIVGKG